jgi:hypothetical protein
MTKFLIFLSFLGTVLISNNLHAQTKTAYEKKVDAITIAFLRDVGLPQIYIDDIIRKGSMKDVMNLREVNSAFSNFTRSDPEYAKLRLLTFVQDMKDAEKLKNEVDIQRGKEKQLAAEKKRQEEENRIEKKRQEESFNRSDLYFLRQKIGEKFTNWQKKGEFEKTEDYEKRISTKTEEAFSDIFLNETTELVNSKKVSAKLEKYDADKEQYSIIITGSKTQQYISDEVVWWRGSINISPEKAQQLGKGSTDYDCTFDKCKWTEVC